MIRAAIAILTILVTAATVFVGRWEPSGESPTTEVRTDRVVVAPTLPTPPTTEHVTTTSRPVTTTTSLPPAHRAASTTSSTIPVRADGVVAWEDASVGPRTASPKPSRITIGEIAVDAPVVEVGVDESSGQMEVVRDVTSVGWYRFGPRPGQSGSAVLAAHVDLAGAGPGVFWDLDHLEDGDSVVIGFDDGSERAFTVADSRRIEKDRIDLDEIFRSDGEPVLRLVTCGGAFDHSRNTYSDNVVVTLLPDATYQPEEG